MFLIYIFYLCIFFYFHGFVNKQLLLLLLLLLSLLLLLLSLSLLLSVSKHPES